MNRGRIKAEQRKGKKLVIRLVLKVLTEKEDVNMVYNRSKEIWRKYCFSTKNKLGFELFRFSYFTDLVEKFPLLLVGRKGTFASKVGMMARLLKVTKKHNRVNRIINLYFVAGYAIFERRKRMKANAAAIN